MFGYVTANQKLLSEEQLKRYRSVYCGLCREIGKRHGQIARITLTYDLTFLVILLDSLYEPEQTIEAKSCVVHPLTKNVFRHSKWTEYCADMNVALAYYNCLDDWNDEHNIKKLAVAQSLKNEYNKIRSQWSEQCDAIQKCLDDLSKLEREKSSDLDACSECFGRLMRKLFAVGDDYWKSILGDIGDRLGRFIYLMDAVIDEQDDLKKERYNPIIEFKKQYNNFDDLPILQMFIGECTVMFEKLPLEQDIDILRNILYSGVWSKYFIEKNKQTKDNKK